MLRNRLYDNAHRNDFVDAGCHVAGQRGCVAVRFARFGKRMRIELPAALRGITAPAATRETSGTQPAGTPSGWHRRGELPAPIWASLVLSRV